MSYLHDLLKCVLFMSLAYLATEVSGDHFLIDCGSTRNTTLGNRIFQSDSNASIYLTTSVDIMASDYADKHLQLYQTARIFTRTARYSFPISQIGRYFIRFHFFPFTYKAYNMSNTRFTISANKFELLSNYTPPQYPTMKEFSVNVTSNFLDIVLGPALNTLGFLNALEVLLVPNRLIQDDASDHLAKAYEGLLYAALETIYRVNVGGPIVGYNNDTLWRTWNPDYSFLEHKNFVVDFNDTRIVKYRSGLSTKDIAPPAVYGTCKRLTITNESETNVNIKWNFDVDPQFQYLVRFHFCDIVSVFMNEMYFDVFVDSWLIFQTLDLTSLARGFLAAPIYVDFVTPTITHNKLTVSIGPSMINGNQPKGILNGLEIMKLNNDNNSLAGNASLLSFQRTSKNLVGIIVWVCVGGVFLLVLAVVLFLSCRSESSQGDS